MTTASNGFIEPTDTLRPGSLSTFPSPLIYCNLTMKGIIPDESKPFDKII